MIRRLLIANRGEIARRIARACRELDVESVAVYSDADVRAPHVLEADRAVRIGPPAPAASYLNVEALLDAARASGADAVHPGYGFLSERAAFARAVEAAGLTFVGPPAKAIELMGSKVSARSLARRAGVPVVPGETPDDQSDAALAAAVVRVGFPVLIKPAAGGGGIGMQVVRGADETIEAVQRARREAASAFGDGTLYVEGLIEAPRHVEIQVMTDGHGGAVHLFERECSVQRRQQKIVEESPCPILTPDLRAAMGDAALAVARAAGYRNAGTVEFLLEGEGDTARFYFLEMNTRLQVEHPVTESVVGVDLVHAQIRVASGEPLAWTQDRLTQRGHAIECRVCAENPAEAFLPQAGRVLLYREPDSPGVRVDSGIVEDSNVPVYYDSLLAKVIAWGETRDVAIRRAAAALRRFPILGIRTNIPFLIAILEHPAFRAGDVDTHFITSHAESLRQATAMPVPPAAFAAAAAPATFAAAAGAAAARVAGTPEASDPFDALAGWRV